jgi:hypothetical protein
MGWDDGIWDGIWDGMGVGILPFPLIWVASIVTDFRNVSKDGCDTIKIIDIKIFLY